jgi:hypothetical protein
MQKLYGMGKTPTDLAETNAKKKKKKKDWEFKTNLGYMAKLCFKKKQKQKTKKSSELVG